MKKEPAKKGTVPAAIRTIAVFAAMVMALDSYAEKTILFDADWKFGKFGKFSDCISLEEPSNPAPCEIGFDDAKWRLLDLPHDWGVESAFLPSEPNQTASLPWAAIGWYRKSFAVPASAKGRRLYLDFDGAMMTPRIWVNGKLAGEWKYGYNSFRIDITDFVQFGKHNTVAVRVENRQDSTRWYPGAGIYRHVYLSVSDPIHFEHWGVAVTVDEIKGISLKPREARAKSAKITIQSEIRNDSDSSVEVFIMGNVETKRNDNPELAIINTQKNIILPAKSLITNTITVSLTGTVPTKSMGTVPIWDIDDPNRLYVNLTLRRADSTLPADSVKVPFGIRTCEWKSDGFYLNGRRVQLKGVCQHHDLGPLGAAVHRRAIERQIEILESFGVNAIRTSHNPPAPELLDICDRRGILVLDELFDCWKTLKEGKRNGYNLFWDDWRYRDVANWVRRDRNHPSVIAWSIGNEIAEQGQGEVGASRARDLVAAVKTHDSTRLVTCGCNDVRAADNAFGKALDIHGFNYKPNNYASFVKNHPGQPFFSSESSSCVSSRGFYSFPANDEDFEPFWRRNFCDNLAICQVSDYGIYAPGWAYAPDVEFAALEDVPQAAGEFVWTGFDYLGEPTPWNLGRKPANDFRGLPESEIRKLEAELEKIKKQGTPSRSSYFGIVDLCGFRKDRAWLYQSHWLAHVPMAHILPHWNWIGLRDGKKTPVFVYTSGDSAELFLNGKSLGKRSKKSAANLTGKDLNGDIRERFRLTWMDVTYEPGRLEVVAYKNGQVWAKDVVETTGAVTGFKAKADRATIKANGQDLSYVEIDLVDLKGRTVPTANDRFYFEVEGPFDLVGVCNGDPTDHESMKGTTIRAFAGKAQAIVRSRRGKIGMGALVIRREKGETKKVAIRSM